MPFRLHHVWHRIDLGGSDVPQRQQRRLQTERQAQEEAHGVLHWIWLRYSRMPMLLKKCLLAATLPVGVVDKPLQL